MKDFQQLQHQFATAIRQPNTASALGVPPARLEVYQTLFFNNLLSFVSSAFPVLRTFYTEAQWQSKVRSFFAQESLSSPFFLDIAECFLAWLQQQPQQATEPNFIKELAHYEWLELYLSTLKRQAPHHPLSSDNIEQPLQLDELALVLNYQWPVQRISLAYQPELPPAQSTFLLMYRDHYDEIRFMELNALTALSLQLLQQQPGVLLAQLIAQLRGYFPHLPAAELKDGATDLFANLACKGLICAFQPD